MTFSSLGREFFIVALPASLQCLLQFFKAGKAAIPPDHVGLCAVLTLHLGLIGWTGRAPGDVLNA
jgi:hypothetical protein